MWFRFSRPDYFYVGRNTLLDAGDASPWNRGWAIGFGFFVLTCRWNEGRSESYDGVHYPDRPRFTVKINGDRLTLSRDVVTYESLITLAGQRPGASVTWSDRESGRSGTLIRGQRVMLTEGMDFCAVMTNAA